MSNITISPLRIEDIPAVAKLHAEELRYSFNSMMGANHLARVYRAMVVLPECFVGVASDAGYPVGVVSGTLNTRLLKSAILHSLGWRGVFYILIGLLRQPTAIFTLLHEMKSRSPVRVANQEVAACLTAIVVATSHRREGLASQLVTSLEDFFRANYLSHYWLDTATQNTDALSFYQSLGFTVVSYRNQTVACLKRLNSNHNR